MLTPHYNVTDHTYYILLSYPFISVRICPSHLLLLHRKRMAINVIFIVPSPPALDQGTWAVVTGEKPTCGKLSIRGLQIQMAKDQQMIMRYYSQTILANQILNLSQIRHQNRLERIVSYHQLDIQHPHLHPIVSHKISQKKTTPRMILLTHFYQDVPLS